MASRTRVSGLLLPAMAILFLACFIGIPLAVVSLGGSDVVNSAALGALAVVFLVGMYLLARRLRSTAPRHFEVIADPLEVRRGEEVEAVLTIYDPDEVAGRLEVGLVCVERYDHPASVEEGANEADRAVGEEVAYERWLPSWRTEEEQVFRFRIPADAPYSHEGECLSFAWRVSAREPERAAEDGTSDDPMWVLP